MRACTKRIASSVFVSVITASACLPGAKADVIQWINPVAGTFQDGANWTGGIAPGPADEAAFGLNPGVANFTVTFADNVNNTILSILDQNPTLDLSGFGYDLTDLIAVYGELPELTVQNGAISAPYFFVDGGTATLNLTGLGASLISDTADIGPSGHGIVLVSAGASLNVPYIRMADSPSGIGELTITGSGSTFAGNIAVGNNGQGTLHILNGAVVTGTGGSVIGDCYPGPGPCTGEVLVTNPGSQWNGLVELFVSGGGPGQLTVSDQASVSGTRAFIGGTLGIVEVTGSGSSMSFNEFVFVGTSGNGTMTVENGAQVLAPTSVIGQIPGSIGMVTVTGIGSQWNAGQLLIGEAGQGSVSITNGADLISSFASIGTSAAGAGTIVVSGPGSTWANSNPAYIGENGHGQLHVLNGGRADTFFNIEIAGPGAVGEVLVDGATSVLDINGGGFFVGGPYNLADGGAATLTISNGAQAVSSTGGATIGGGDSGIGTVAVSGSGSQWLLGEVLFVHRGSLLVEAGAVVSDVRSEIGTGATSNGSVTVRGPLSSWMHLNIVDVGSYGPSTALLTVEDGAHVVAPGGIGVGPGGDHRIRGVGTLDANVGSNGRIEPGMSAGILDINGNYIQGAEGALQIEIGGLTAGTQYDRFVVTGTANLAGRLEIELINGFDPQVGDTFEILQYASRSGQFETVSGQVIGGGRRFVLYYGPTNLTLGVCDGDPACDDCNLNGVPDGQDIADMTSQDMNPPFGVPDECSQFVAQCVMDTDWSCTGNWMSLDGSDPYPNNVPANYSVTLDQNPDTTQDDVFLDVTVSIDSLRMLDDSTLRVSQSGGAGDLNIVTPQGLLVESNLQIGNGRTISASNAQVTIGPGGVYESDPLAGPATGALITGDLTLFRGTGCDTPCTPDDGGTLELTGSMSLTVTGDMLLDGTGADPCPAGARSDSGRSDEATEPRSDEGMTERPVASAPGSDDARALGTRKSAALPALMESTIGNRQSTIHDAQAVKLTDSMRGLIPPPRLRMSVLVLASTDIFGDLTVIGPVDLLINSDNNVLLDGNFVNRCNSPGCFDWASGGMDLVSLTGQTFEAAGRDLGLTQAGFDNGTDTNFSMARVEVGPLGIVTLVNNFANTDGLGLCSEALYVRDLTLRSGSTITLNNTRVYYRTLTNEGATITPQGCGALIEVADCVDDGDCSDVNACTADTCLGGGECGYEPIPSLAYGDVNNTGVVDVDDILCMLDAFSGNTACPLERTDMFPCGGATSCFVDADCASLGVPCVNGGCFLIDVDDILVMLDAFSGTLSCPDPCSIDARWR